VLLRAVAENPFEQVVVLIHGVTSQTPEKANFSGRPGQSTAAIRRQASLIPRKVSIRPINGKARSRVKQVR
jgi:hypothetical protein